MSIAVGTAIEILQWTAVVIEHGVPVAERLIALAQEAGDGTVSITPERIQRAKQLVQRPETYFAEQDD